ncbi:Cu(I)-responsive transcriptional regulator [Prosthecodimorpha staleyi]|uniref:Cu(I)-responsive transcriptional regulator n=1 Tax=Prosthecodimorpha staleyi TaxID=2840188 RepID=A0A947D9L3_9HYPH|nr:Cu(I)-responsive transcriptional regulator [Prosthecodimorpha staleyi]MBT9292181.1 Cu(I)-responsive transcriptional regulator [Prosthecodimorpha staleyi]
MNIAAAAGAAGLTAKAVRYYESVGLLAAPRRDNGYRDYGPAEIARLKFLARARNLGFSVDECRALLSLWSDSCRSSADVRAMAQTRIREIEAKIAELESLKRSLGSLVAACHGDDRPDCPIIDDLAGCGHAH